MSSHDYMPDPAAVLDLRNHLEPLHVQRAFALYMAILLVGQRTPEELVEIADYLTGAPPMKAVKVGEWRNG